MKKRVKKYFPFMKKVVQYNESAAGYLFHRINCGADNCDGAGRGLNCCK